ncbi:tyrosine-protein phosphatase [Rhodococcus sp. D2-41]|uniref:Tyrosine-protein phosphatase n=1 Tax=Speluncibacter jeojiensis TaxID=2710754 RepID=A0A9X4RE66_9ACTN|nr:tyrosine-protein phosphatase [Rhodococcus sp. D2-41]MDG3009063.1 tyrosine-protein phosphatase [Rhodococcus sp. D2-41]MDG3015575.1 tyrosine-protein phosphatase [Corynebacteriales bacterium D3-21]
MTTRPTRTAATLAIAAALVAAPVPALALASPAPVLTAAQTTFDRSLHLAGASNARDIGGYETTDGHTVKTGVVFRSNALDKLTAADLTKLQDLNVRTVIDFRTVFERALAPDKLPAGASGYWDDVVGGSGNPANYLTMLDMPSFYKLMATDPGAEKAFHSAFTQIIDSPGASLYHCTSGKDRTGWMTAVLLTILGVPRDTVNADYMLSNQYLAGGGGSGSAGSLGNTGSLGALQNTVQQAWLDDAFGAATAEYGSFDNYVSQGLGLTAADIAALKAKLLS